MQCTLRLYILHCVISRMDLCMQTRRLSVPFAQKLTVFSNESLAACALSLTICFLLRVQ